MQQITDWLQETRRKHAAGQLADADFDALQSLLDGPARPRQQLLYLQAGSTSPLSRIVGMARFVPGERQDKYSLAATEFPYQTVMEAVEDGWRIVQFPVPPTAFSDEAVDYLGFEFILEQVERAMITMTEIRPSMTDREVARFVNYGYVLLEAVIPDAVNREIYDFIASGREGGQNMLANGLVERVTLNSDCLGVVRSLLGRDFEVPANYHVHPTSPSTLCWHSDGISDRRLQLHSLQNYYFPQEVRPDMGPTVILPGSHLRHVNRDALAHYAHIRGAKVMTVPAGTVVFTHYSLWHARQPALGEDPRWMIKYAYRRTTPPRRDWVTDREEVTDERVFWGDRHPYTGEFEYYRERFIRRRLFNWLCGLGDDPIDGSGPDKFHPTRRLR